MISQRAKYALHALLALARKNGSLMIGEIAANERIPRKFLEKIIKDLIHSGLVSSHRGAHGGYTLARTPDQVSFRDVMEAVEGPFSINVCVTGQRDCSVLASCNMQRVWQEGQRRMLEFFADTTLADLGPAAALNTTPAAVV